MQTLHLKLSFCSVEVGAGAGDGAVVGVGERWRCGIVDVEVEVELALPPRASMIRQRARYSSSVGTWSKRGRFERLRLVNDSRQCKLLSSK